MYDYFFGKVISISENYIILDVNNIGYKIFVINSDNLKLNYFIKIYIFYFFNESTKQFYGFINKLEREVFSRLIEVRKIGVKTAFLILKKYSYEDILRYIQNNDEEMLLAIPKITKDNIKSLFQKFSNFNYICTFDINKEVLSVLRSLEYDDKEIFKVYKKIDSKKDINEQIKEAIRLLEERV